VNRAEVATPLALVRAVFVPPAKLPVGPLGGAVKTTATPASGFPLASLTSAVRKDAKGVLTGALCGVPPVAVIDAGTPAVLVTRKLAGAAIPATEARTV
jgi:hypothetical protein